MELGKVLRKAAGVFVELPGDRSPADPGDADPSAQTPPPQRSAVPAPPAPAAQRQAVPASAHGLQRVGLHDASQTHAVVQPSRPPIASSPPPPVLQPPAPPPPKPPSPTAAPPGLSFSTIYLGAQVSAQAFTAEQLLEMLASMPPELPLDTKRRTVHGMLQAMSKTTSASVDAIVADATAKLNALSAHVEQYTRHAADRITTMDGEIRALEQQIEGKRREAEQVRAQLTQTTAVCRDEWLRLAEVLDFFNVSRPQAR